MLIPDFSQKLEAILRERNMTQVALARLAGVTPRYLSRVKTGDGEIPESFMRKICAVLEIQPEDFTATNNNQQNVSDLYYPVPLREAGGGMGGGVATGSKRIVSYISLRKDFLLTKTNNLEALSFINAMGDSMAPTIPDGASVLIDGSQTEPVNGKIFYVMHNNSLLIKRLEVQNGKVMALISDGWNSKEVLEEQDTFQILGKAILQQTLL